MAWFLKKNGVEIGPIAHQELLRMAVNGEIGPDTPVKRDEGKWNVAKNVKGLSFDVSNRGYPAISLLRLFMGLQSLACVLLGLAATFGVFTLSQNALIAMAASVPIMLTAIVAAYFPLLFYEIVTIGVKAAQDIQKLSQTTK